MEEYLPRKGLLEEYDRQHKGPPGGARKIIETYPAADVRPVVLCRDCAKYKTKYCAIDIWHVDATIFKAKDTDFCSYGERK